MSMEKFAFISVHDKDMLDDLAPAVDSAGYSIISLGGTADRIAGLGISVILSNEFEETSINPEALLGLEEREQREIIGAHIAQRMSLGKQQLSDTNRAGIDLVYINLMPPAAIYNDLGGLGHKRDKGGVLMLEAALEGSRTVLTTPDQIPEYVQFLKTGPYSFEAMEDFRLMMASEANNYLADYAAQVSALGGFSIKQLR